MIAAQELGISYYEMLDKPIEDKNWAISLYAARRWASAKLNMPL